MKLRERIMGLFRHHAQPQVDIGKLEALKREDEETRYKLKEEAQHTDELSHRLDEAVVRQERRVEDIKTVITSIVSKMEHASEISTADEALRILRELGERHETTANKQ
jgi:hypothetical protein